MRRILLTLLSLLTLAGLLALLAIGLHTRGIPLGWPGEWTWSRLPPGVNPDTAAWLVGIVLTLAFAAFVVLIRRRLATPEPVSKALECACVCILALTSIGVQFGLQSAAPDGYGLSKWAFALHSPGSNGYFSLARTAAMRDPAAFWRNYPEWIRQQDALHVGTHPPALFLAWRAVLQLTTSNPSLAATLAETAPLATRRALGVISTHDPLTQPERAALVLVGWLTLISCALTVIPIYQISKSLGGTSAQAWTAASFWPLVPSAILFQPTADTAYPLLATLAVALVLQRHWIAQVYAGFVLAIGMQITLAFLGVGLLTGLAILFLRPEVWRKRVQALLWTGLGFAGLTALIWMTSWANPLAIWWSNQANHARFYVQFPRTYWVWVWLNPLEFAVGLGLPVCWWLLLGLRAPRLGRLAWLTIGVLSFLQFSGRNLSEVARLWLPFMPALLPAAALGVERVRARDVVLFISLVLLALQTLQLQANIQVVYALAD
jgi:hypothetical protein